MSATGDTSTPNDSDGHLRVTQVRSGIGTKPKHRATLRALGLRVGQCRLPMGASTPELDAQAQKILAAVGPPAVSGAPLA